MKLQLNKIGIDLLLIFSLVPILLSGCESKPDVKIIAHRGGMAGAPENTMAAFQRSVELGADMLELDLRTSSDGQLFILHDERLDRTTDSTGVATELMMEELRQLDAGAWFDSKYSGERIPSFQEVLAWANGEEVGLLLDLKESGPKYAERIASDIRSYDMEKYAVIGVRSPEQAQAFRELLPGVRQLGFIGSPDDIESYAAAGVDVIRLWLRWLEEDSSLADRVRETGKKLMINGTDGEPEETKTIMKYVPDWILIDDPAQLMESLNSTGFATASNR